MHVVVDQRNALELEPDLIADMNGQLKVTIWTLLNKLRAAHRYIFSASANARSDKYRNLKQSRIKTIYLRDGLRKVRPSLFNYLASCSQDEADAWFQLHATSLPPLSDEDRTFVESMTGNIPPLLRPLLNIKVFDKAIVFEMRGDEKSKRGNYTILWKTFQGHSPNNQRRPVSCFSKYSHLV